VTEEALDEASRHFEEEERWREANPEKYATIVDIQRAVFFLEKMMGTYAESRLRPLTRGRFLKNDGSGKLRLSGGLIACPPCRLHSRSPIRSQKVVRHSQICPAHIKGRNVRAR
jgi:hypothetical protein